MNKIDQGSPPSLIRESGLSRSKAKQELGYIKVSENRDTGQQIDGNNSHMEQNTEKNPKISNR